MHSRAMHVLTLYTPDDFGTRRIHVIACPQMIKTNYHYEWTKLKGNAHSLVIEIEIVINQNTLKKIHVSK